MIAWHCRFFTEIGIASAPERPPRRRREWTRSKSRRRGIVRRQARRVGRFDYRVNLPGISDTEDVQASLDKGVLTVRVPKPEHAKRRRIEIRSG